MSRSRSMILTLAALFTLTFTVACSNQPAQAPTPPDTRKADEAAIRAASADWSKAAQAKDLDKAVSFYAEDGIYFADKGAMVKGRNSISLVWKGLLAQPGPGLSFSASYVEVARSGDMAYEYGTYSIVTEVKKGKPTTEKGKYVTVWKKQKDGSWKVAIDIDNTGE
jgi:uncharacterized protein (TIGR02246 family)